jgi:hypothetical protein
MQYLTSYRMLDKKKMVNKTNEENAKSVTFTCGRILRGYFVLLV